MKYLFHKYYKISNRSQFTLQAH